MHMFPFTLAELSKTRRKFSAFARAPLADFDLNNSSETAALLETLLRVSGFPEPFVKGKTGFWSRWSANYLKQVVMEDIRNLADLKKTDTVELLFSLLPSRVASPISISNLAADLRSNFRAPDMLVPISSTPPARSKPPCPRATDTPPRRPGTPRSPIPIFCAAAGPAG